MTIKMLEVMRSECTAWCMVVHCWAVGSVRAMAWYTALPIVRFAVMGSCMTSSVGTWVHVHVYLF